MSDFLKYARENQHPGNCTRAEAFTMGQRSRQSKIDQLKAEKGLQEIEINQLACANQEWQRLSKEKDSMITKLKAQLNNMEQCYIEMKKQLQTVGES